MKILSIQVGKPQTHYIPDPTALAKGKVAEGKAAEGEDNGWSSGIFKSIVEGPRFLGKTNLEGDGQADLKNHGGPDKAVCTYAHEHYAYWQNRYGLSEIPTGAFGENFTTLGLLEREMCIGDTLVVGEARRDEARSGEAQEVIIQLTQPRAPCWKLARRWQIADFALQVELTGYTGWYFRVLQEGIVQPGDEMRLLDRPYPQFTVAEANRVMHHDTEDWQTIAQLMECPLLSSSWRSSFRRRFNLHAPQELKAQMNALKEPSAQNPPA